MTTKHLFEELLTTSFDEGDLSAEDIKQLIIVAEQRIELLDLYDLCFHKLKTTSVALHAHTHTILDDAELSILHPEDMGASKAKPSQAELRRFISAAKTVLSQMDT